MKYLAFCLLLGMSAQGQDDPCQSAKLYYDGVLVDEEPHCGFLFQTIHMPTALDDITRAEFAQAAQRAADETDGKPQNLAIFGVSAWDDGPPHKPWDEVDGMCGGAPPHPCNQPPAELVDVPAVQEPIEAAKCFERYDGCQVTDEKGRSLSTAEWLYYTGAFAKLKYSRQSCADKSRVLLTSEDGKKHCIKF